MESAWHNCRLSAHGPAEGIRDWWIQDLLLGLQKN